MLTLTKFKAPEYHESRGLASKYFSEKPVTRPPKEMDRIASSSGNKEDNTLYSAKQTPSEYNNGDCRIKSIFDEGVRIKKEFHDDLDSNIFGEKPIIIEDLFQSHGNSKKHEIEPVRDDSSVLSLRKKQVGRGPTESVFFDIAREYSAMVLIIIKLYVLHMLIDNVK